MNPVATHPFYDKTEQQHITVKVAGFFVSQSALLTMCIQNQVKI